MFIKHLSKSKLATSAGALMLLAGLSFGGASVAQAAPNSSDYIAYGTVGVEALQARSAAIPLQPEADPETGRAVATGSKQDVANPQSVQNEPVWTRTCDRGSGLEIWNAQAATDCAGTMHYYEYNIEKASFNMAAYIASQPGSGGNIDTLLAGLDSWCSAHSFQCTVAVGAAFFGASLLFG